MSNISCIAELDMVACWGKPAKGKKRRAVGKFPKDGPK
jgi:hypothetical protein